MQFNSFSFLVFFPTVVILYYLLPQRWRKFLLLGASIYFYMAFVPQYVLILLFLIASDYVLARIMQPRTGRARRALLLVSIAANLGTLFFFKYFNFFNHNVAALARFLNWNYSPFLLQIALPLGLSFHVFQSLSYVIEVYRGKYEPERNFWNYALYVMFFPQLVAGPIERPQQLLPQFRAEHPFDTENVRTGLQRMLWGFFKKVVVADMLAGYVSQIYLSPHDYPAPMIAVATIFFTFQIYCDFSGYSDIAVGAARVLGFTLVENFAQPFLSRSIAEFWQRWHISLSSWLRDYLYFPIVMASRRKSRAVLYGATPITFILIGLWHGANWTYVLFGTLHGVYLVCGQATKPWRDRIYTSFGNAAWVSFARHAIQTLSVFVLAAVSFAFFRAQSVRDALYIAPRLFSGSARVVANGAKALISLHPASLSAFVGSLTPGGTGRVTFALSVGLIVLIIAADILIRSGKIVEKVNRHWTLVRWGLYAAAALCIMNLGATHEVPFIYFAF